VRFLVAGSGTAEPELREQATQLGLDEHGTFLGWIGDDVLHSLYRIADLTVVPRSMSASAWSLSRRWRRAAPAWWPTPAVLREVVPHEDVGLRFRSRDRARWPRWPSGC
jgi:glycogen synthase